MDVDESSRDSISNETVNSLGFSSFDFNHQPGVSNVQTSTLLVDSSDPLVENYRNSGYLDGRFFQVISHDITKNKVKAKCKLCPSTFSITKTVSSN